MTVSPSAIISNKIVSRLFGNDTERFQTILNAKLYSNTKITLQLATEPSTNGERLRKAHVDISDWNAFDQDLQPVSGQIDDLITYYENPYFHIEDTSFKKYEIGAVIVEKTSIQEITLKNLRLPFRINVSSEKTVNSTHNMVPTSYVYTWRKKYLINPNIYCLSPFAQKYIRDWNVTKIVRKIIPKKELRMSMDIDNPVQFDMLDIEFEYMGEDVSNGFLSLFEFLFIRHCDECDRKPNCLIYKEDLNLSFIPMFTEISSDFLLFNSLSNNLLPELIKPPEIINISIKAEKKIQLPENVKRYIMIYIADDNYIKVSSIIDFSHYKGSSTMKFSVLNVYEVSTGIYLISDIYVYDKEVIVGLTYGERIEHIKDLMGVSEMFIDSYESPNMDFLQTIYHLNQVKYYFRPSNYYIDLKLNLLENETSMIFFTQNNVLLNSPLLLSPIYTPKTRNELEKDISKDIHKYDGKCLKFQVLFHEGDVSAELIPVEEAPKPMSAYECLSYMLSAYMNNYNISSDSIENFSDSDMLLQTIIEKLNLREFRNINLLSEDEYDISRSNYALKVLLMFTSAREVTLSGSHRFLISNLLNYYSSTYIEPIRDSTVVIKNGNVSIHALNNTQSIQQIPKFFMNDMDLIITTFIEFRKLSQFINVMKHIQANIRPSGTTILNYFNKALSMEEKFMFLFNLEKVVYSTEDLAKHAHKDLLLIKDKLNRTDIELIQKRAKLNTLIMTNTKINNSKLGEVGQKLPSYSHSYIISHEKDMMEQEMFKLMYDRIWNDEDPIRTCVQHIASSNEFKITTYHPYEDEVLMDLVAHNARLFKRFNVQDINYSDFISIQIEL